MVLHLGHLVQSPSGISRFLDLADASFGFLAKVVWLFAGGGVTAGSAVSSPRVFFVNKVVAISPNTLSCMGTPNKPPVGVQTPWVHDTAPDGTLFRHQ